MLTSIEYSYYYSLFNQYFVALSNRDIKLKLNTFENCLNMAGWQALQKLPHNDPLGYCLILKHSQSSICTILDRGIMFKYNNEDNLWSKLNISNKLPPGFLQHCWVHSACIDSDDDKVYFLNINGSMAILKLKANETMRWNVINNLIKIGNGSQGIMIENQFHAIGGLKYQFNSNNNTKARHVIYNDETQKLDILHEFGHEFGYHRLVKINETVLLFGGCDHHKKLKSIYEYKIREKTWNLLPISMPTALIAFGCVKVLNGKNVLLFGGATDRRFNDNVWIYCVGNQSFIESSIKCPGKSEYDAVSICNRKRDKCITFGFVRDCWNTCQINSKNHVEILLERVCAFIG